MINYEPFVLELNTHRDAMVLAVKNGHTHIMAETNCQAVVMAWEQGTDRSIGGHIILEMSTYLRHFQHFVLRWTERESNFVAHSCAKRGFRVNLSPS